MDYPHKKRAWALAASIYYLGGVTGAWLALTWHGFTEFPFREIGASAWPVLLAAIVWGSS